MRYKSVKTGEKYGVFGVNDAGVQNLEPLSVHVLESEAIAEIARLVSLENETVEASFSESSELTTKQVGSDGSAWEVMILKFGKSKTPPHYYYSEPRMTENISAFDGAKLYMHSRSDRAGHVSDPNKKSSRDIVGFISGAKIQEGIGVVGVANILPSFKWLRENLKALASKNKMDVLQLSIDGLGAAQPRMIDGEKLPEVTKLAQVDVDIVPRGAAGGAFLKMAESLPHPEEFKRLINSQTEGTNMNLLQKVQILFMALYPARFVESNFDWTKVNENELWTKLLEADKPQDRLHLPDGTALSEGLVDDKTKAILAEIKEAASGSGKPKPKVEEGDNDAAKVTAELQKKIFALEQSNLRQVLESVVAKTKLPEVVQNHIKKAFLTAKNEVRSFQESELLDYIKATREVFGKVNDGSKENQYHVSEGMAAEDKSLIGLERFFLGASRKPLTAEEVKEFKGIPAFTSFKEGYIQLTGDTQVTGFQKNAVKLSESIVTGDFPKMLGELINKVMVREYSLMALDTWRAWASIVPVNDFRTQHRVRWGGYANLPTVAQRAPYLPLTSPTDEEATYLATKKGGTEDLTRESILNDDVGWLQRIPMRLARASAQTIHEFCYNFVYPNVNPVIYDGVVLYHATNPTAQPHANTATTALGTDGVALGAARARMKKQGQKDNLKRLGLRPRYLLVPSDLEQIAYGLLTPAYNQSNQVPTFLQNVGMTVIPVDYWTDATDWAIIADPADIAGFELGFVGGVQDPMILVSDTPNSGSLFTNDVITFKIRHEYGGAILDYRAFDGSVVA